jgi:hypothetical protein
VGVDRGEEKGRRRWRWEAASNGGRKEISESLLLLPPPLGFDGQLCS